MTPADLARAVAGGALIGLSAGALLLLTGRIAGVSGILGGLLQPRPGDAAWRVFFVGGLATGGVLLALVAPACLPGASAASLGRMVVAGLLVGLGARIAGGCTSGHGICGVGRFSTRSIVATGLFIALGMATVWVVRHGVGTL